MHARDADLTIAGGVMARDRRYSRGQPGLMPEVFARAKRDISVFATAMSASGGHNASKFVEYWWGGRLRPPGRLLSTPPSCMTAAARERILQSRPASQESWELAMPFDLLFIPLQNTPMARRAEVVSYRPSTILNKH